MTGGDVEQAKKLYNTFFDTFPGIKTWMAERHKELERTGNYVTTYIGNKLLVEANTQGGRERVACNAPIQSLSSLIAGTSMYQFSEYCDKMGWNCHPFGFTHDAYDDSTPIIHLFEYLEAQVKIMQTDIFDIMGVPMRIDYEIGIDGINMCGISFTKLYEGTYEVILEGTKEGTEGIVELMRESGKYQLSNIEVLESKTKSYGWDELFTVGKAMKYEWGKTLTTQSIKFTSTKVI